MEESPNNRGPTIVDRAARGYSHSFLTIVATGLGAAMVAPWVHSDQIMLTLEKRFPVGLSVTVFLVIYYLIHGRRKVKAADY